MASHAATHHAAMRIDHTSILTAVLGAHRRFGQIDHAFVGAAGSIVRLTSVMQETDQLRHFVERDEFLERTWLAANQHLHVAVRPHQFQDACQAVGAALHPPGATPQVGLFTVQATLADGTLHTVQFVLAKVETGSSGEWHRNMCSIRIGGSPWMLPTDLAVFAAFMRLTPLFQCSPARISRGFTRRDPPPVPGELIWFHAEWQIQYGLEEIGLPHRGFLSAAAWERDISHLMSAQDYAMRARHLHALLVASEEPPEANEEPVNLLVEHAARMDMMEMGHNPDSHDERDRDLLADLMLGLEHVIEAFTRRFTLPYPSPHHAVARS